MSASVLGALKKYAERLKFVAMLLYFHANVRVYLLNMQGVFGVYSGVFGCIRGVFAFECSSCSTRSHIANRMIILEKT